MARRAGQPGYLDQQGRRDSGRGDAGGAAVARPPGVRPGRRQLARTDRAGRRLRRGGCAGGGQGRGRAVAVRRAFGAGVARGHVGRWPHIAIGWLAGVYGVARALALPLALGTAVAAGLMAARRAGRRQQRPLADALARQGTAAGLCAGAVAALVFCVLSTGTDALLPHMVKPLLWVFTKPRPPVWTLAGGHLPHPSMYNAALYQFEMSVADTAAGYLLALLCFPLFGAGLGAWGGLFAAGYPGRRPGGGGGGGGGGGT